VVSLDRVRVQAKRWRVTEGAELARLVIHGVLHLCGHDHMKAAERRVMRAYEEAAMSEAGTLILEMDRRWPGRLAGRPPARPAARPASRSRRH
jgi:hypothetical protein